VVDVHRDILSLQGSSNVSVHQGNLKRWGRIVYLAPKAGTATFDPNEVASEDELSMLSGLADILNYRIPEEEAAPEKVDELIDSTNILINEVTAADDLDPDLRVFLLRHLAHVMDALRTVRIRGQRGVDEVLGNLVIDSRLSPSVWQRVKSWPSWGKVQTVIKGLSMIARAKDDITQIASFTEELLQIEGPQGGG
jgi:hypothetical protein